MLEPNRRLRGSGGEPLAHCRGACARALHGRARGCAQTLLEHKDRAGLQRLLSPAFQVQRADGSGAGRKEYLANLATITKFQITKLTATRANGVLVVRYLADATGLVNGKSYTPGPAPRLSVFREAAEATVNAPELREAMGSAGVDASSVRVEYLDEMDSGSR